jgi:hypothetical protein
MNGLCGSTKLAHGVLSAGSWLGMEIRIKLPAVLRLEGSARPFPNLISYFFFLKEVGRFRDRQRGVKLPTQEEERKGERNWG